METKTISEYGYIYKITTKPNNLSIKFVHAEVEETQFDELYEYWKEDYSAKKVLEFDGYNLKATSYVGIIQTRNLSIEILPKIYNQDSNL